MGKITNNKIEYINNNIFSFEEIIIIDKFLSQYRNRNLIIADEYEETISKTNTLKGNNLTRRIIGFQRNIEHNSESYGVDLQIISTKVGYSYSKEYNLKLYIYDMIRDVLLDFTNNNHKELLKEIETIFSSTKIISPLKHLSDKLNISNTIYLLIENNNWDKLKEFIDNNPDNINYLYKDDPSSKEYNWDKFGTILYQLVQYKIINNKKLNTNTLQELNNLITKYSDTEYIGLSLYNSNTPYYNRTISSLNTTYNEIKELGYHYQPKIKKKQF